MPEEQKEKIRASNLRRPLAQEKACRTCGVVQPRTAFGSRKDNHRHVRSNCRACERELWREWRKRNPDKVKLRQREADLRIKYGMTPEGYDELLERQGGRCAICGGEQASQGRANLAVDHCHETGRVRGLLCDRCNAGVGMLGDDPERVRAASPT